jgi:SHS family lactate transporter-like MFS transporter
VVKYVTPILIHVDNHKVDNQKVDTARRTETRNAGRAVATGFLGWTIDAFDFFVLVFCVSAIAKEFGRSVPDVALTITASLITRPVGAFVFGLLADRFGRRPILIANIAFYSAMAVLSGLAPSYTVFFALRLLYGVGMGGNWGVGASLALEAVPAKWRGAASGLLQEGYAVGNGLAALAYLTVYPHFGWRAMFFVGAIPAILTILLCLSVEESRAWKQSRTDAATYRAILFSHWKLFLFLCLLMSAMAFTSHGTQDMYPTFLQQQRGFSSQETSIVTFVGVLGALGGGIVLGHASNSWGRRRTIVCVMLCGLAVIPLWILAPTKGLLMLGAFLIQVVVQGAWGTIPAHINELSPPEARGFFPGFCYQIGALVSSGAGYIEARFAEAVSYSTAMGVMAAIVFVSAAIIAGLGPEKRGREFIGRGR